MTPTPAPRPGLRDVARRAGVSHQTVSRVFKDDRLVAAATRERVLAAAAELDFRPNHAARALATGRSRTIGVVSFDAPLFGTAAIVAAVEQSARASGYFTSVVSLDSAGDGTIGAAARRFRDQGVDGVIIVPGYVAADDALRELPRDLPAVLVGATDLAPSVVVDHRAGARAVTAHLLAAGHATVHHLPGPAAWYEAREREQGWREALTAAGVAIPTSTPGDWSARSGYERGRALAADPAVTAVFAANDHIALGLLRALHETGRAVPADVAVAGFDDIPEAAYLWPPLTSVRQDFAAVGSRCVEALLIQLRPDPPKSTTVTVESALIPRESSSPQ